MRVSKTYYNDAQMTDMNSLARALVAAPAQISPILTHLGGREDKRFPLTMLTEGTKNTVSIDRLEYEYNVKTRVDRTRELTDTVTSNGKGGAQFHLPFRDRWFIKQYVLISQSGKQVRIMGDPVPQGDYYLYPVRLVEPDPEDFVPASDLVAGARWGQMFAPVGVDFSRGNASNWTVPSKVAHKLTTLRKSYQMSGNARDFVMEFELPIGGKNTKMWMDYEEWQYYLQWLEEKDSFYMYGRQSYNEAGKTSLLDENGQPIIIGPGLLQQIINKDTYSELTVDKLKAVIRELFFGMTDAQKREVTLMTGLGGMEEFDRAMKEEIGSSAYTVLSTSEFISGSGRSLSFGGYFTTYQHIDGHVIRVVHNPAFDDGIVTQTSGRHPRTGLPLESYRMVFLDQSVYDGQRNLVMVTKKNRELIRWAVAGSTIPPGFSGNDLRASDIDGCSVHFLKTAGILLRRFDTSLDLQCVAA